MVHKGREASLKLYAYPLFYRVEHILKQLCVTGDSLYLLLLKAEQGKMPLFTECRYTRDHCAFLWMFVFGKQALRCTRSEQYLQSSKVVPGEESARRLRSSSLSRVTCLSWNRTVSIFSFTWWLSMWAGGGEEAWPGVPVWVSMSLVACAIHKAQMMGGISTAPSVSFKCPLKPRD